MPITKAKTLTKGRIERVLFVLEVDRPWRGVSFLQSSSHVWRSEVVPIPSPSPPHTLENEKTAR